MQERVLRYRPEEVEVVSVSEVRPETQYCTSCQRLHPTLEPVRGVQVGMIVIDLCGDCWKALSLILSTRGTEGGVK